MKSPKKNGIGEVVTDYGRRVMRIFKKGLLQRSLFDFYGDIKADSVKIKESSSVPGTPVDGDGGVIYIKSTDGKLYFKSNEVAEIELSAADTVLTSEQVQDIVGAMFSSNTETNITVTYQDADGTIDLVATDTNTQLTTEEVQDIVGAMFTSNTETRISATYEDSDGTIDLAVDDMTADTQLTTEQVQDIVGAMFSGNTETRISVTYEDGDGTIDLVVDAIPVDLTVDGAGTIHANNVPTLNQDTTGNANTATTAQRIIGAADADVAITSDGNVNITLDNDDDESTQKLKIINSSGTEVGSISEDGDFYVTGDVTNSGSDNDLKIHSDGNMIFVLDRDNDETSQSFSFKNFNVEIANLDESGNLQIDGDLTVSGGNITNAVTFDSGLTCTGNLTVNGDSVTFESANADDPIFTLKNTSNDTDDAAQMIFVKDRGVAPAVGTNIGEVRFQGEDSNQNSQEYGGFLCEIDVATDGQESGKFGIFVATHDGELQYGLQLTGGSEEDEVDVSIAQGANSSTSVAGNLNVTGDLTITGNDIKDSSGSAAITFDGSANTNVRANLGVTGTITATDGSENIVLNSTASDGNPLLTFKQNSTRRAFIQLADNTGGFENHMRIASEYGPVSIAAASTAGSDTDTVYLMVEPTGVFKFGAADADAVLTTDGNMTFRIDADNDETGQKFSFENNASTEVGSLDESGNLNVAGIITGKQRQIYNQSFIDDLGTDKHYLPWKDINEQTTIYQEEVAMIAPYDGRIVSVTMRCSALSGSGTRTIQIHTFGPNASQFTTANWTMEEEEDATISSSDDNHVFYYVFDNAKHFESGELVVLSVQDDTDLTTSFRYTYVSTVVEWDYNSGLGTGTSSAEFDSAQ